MKRYIFLILVLLTFTGVQAQTGIEQILRNIEANNKDIKSNVQLTEAQKLEAKTDNNLPDPTVSYSHLWGPSGSGETIGELEISQSFDFPSLYVTRNKLNKIKARSFDYQAAAFRRDILLNAKEICLDIIQLRRQKAILDERLSNAEDLSELYQQRFERGDANIIETNKINLELLNVRTEATLNETALKNKIQELTVLNGNIPVVFTDNSYPEIIFPQDYDQLRSEVLASDYMLQAMEQESAAARKAISVNRSQWLPKLEVGYRRDKESPIAFNGVQVGFSIPLFENRNKVKIAKAQAFSAELQQENVSLQTESELLQLYREAETLRNSIKEYEKTFQVQSDVQLLRQALTGRQISMIEYYVEVSVFYDSKLTYISLQNQYQKVIARIYKNRL